MRLRDRGRGGWSIDRTPHSCNINNNKKETLYLAFSLLFRVAIWDVSYLTSAAFSRLGFWVLEKRKGLSPAPHMTSMMKTPDEKRSDDETPSSPYEEAGDQTSGRLATGQRDVFGSEEGHQIKYKTLSWQLVAVLMIAEIVSNGMLSLPSSGGVVGVS